MRERGWGRIVNVGSSSTREPIGGLTLSNSHRPGLVGYLKTLAREVAADGITVNDVATGRFATDRLAANWGGWEQMERGAARGRPAGRLGQPDEYGDLVAFLASERAAYITGTSIPIDGGLLRSVYVVVDDRPEAARVTDRRRPWRSRAPACRSRSARPSSPDGVDEHVARGQAGADDQRAGLGAVVAGRHRVPFAVA